MQGVTHFKLHCNGIKLKNRDGLFGKSDPFVLIRNARGDRVGFSDIVMNNLNPFWRPIEIPLNVFGGPSGVVNVQVWDFDEDGKNDIIGEFSTTIDQLTSQLNKKWELVDPRKKKTGHFVVSKVDRESKPELGAYKIIFAAEKLARMDGLFGKSDPFIIINAHPKGLNTTGHIVAKSEYIKSNLNPVWQPLYISPNLTSGYETSLVVQVWDFDGDGTHDLIGEAQTSLRQLIQEGQQLLLKNKKSEKKNSGMFFVRQVTAIPPVNEQTPVRVTLSFKAQRLDNKDLLSKSDPYLKISRHGHSHVVYKTNHINNNLNPVWPAFEVEVAQCSGMDEPLDLEVHDYDSTSKDDLIGSTTLTLRHLSFFEKNPAWPLLNKEKKGKMGYKNSGFLILEKFVPHYGNAHGGFGQPAPGGFPAQPHHGGPPHGYPPQQGGFPPQQGGFPPQQGGFPPHGGHRAAGGFGENSAPAYGAVQPGLAPAQPYVSAVQPGLAPAQPYASTPMYGAPPAQGAYGSYAQPAPGGYPPQQPGVYGQTRDVQAQGAPQQDFMAPPQNFQPPPGSGSLYNF